MKRWLMTMILLISAVGSVGTRSMAGHDDRQALEERSTLFWEARVKDDWATLYDYLSVSKDGKTTKEQFTTNASSRAPFRYLTFEITDVAVSGSLGWVKTVYTMQPRAYSQLPPQRIDTWQVWHKNENHWIPVPQDQRTEVPKLPPHLRPVEEEMLLTRRVHEFWEAKEKGDWETIYQYCDPAFRERVPAEEFMQQKAMRIYLAHSVEWTEVEGEQGKVRILYTHRPNDPSLAKLDPQEDHMVENWVKVGGVWYRHIAEPTS